MTYVEPLRLALHASFTSHRSQPQSSLSRVLRLGLKVKREQRLSGTVVTARALRNLILFTFTVTATGLPAYPAAHGASGGQLADDLYAGQAARYSAAHTAETYRPQGTNINHEGLSYAYADASGAHSREVHELVPALTVNHALLPASSPLLDRSA